MEPIDVAAERLKVLIPVIDGYGDTIRSEEDTRLKVLNPMFTEVLGWPMKEILTEERSGRSGFVDYKLTVDGLARLVVEAKRDGRDLGLKSHTAGRAYKLSGPVFTTSSVTEGIEQAIRYCGQKNAERACVTNGREWIVFRGSRIGDGQDTMEGYGFVFPSLDAVQARFALFYDLLAFERVAELHYRAHFQEVEGRPIRAHTSRKALRSQDSRRLISNKLSNDLNRVMASFFQRLSGDTDPELLARCFVVTRESQRADEGLARISEDLLGRIQDLETESGAQLAEVVERVRTTQKNEFVILVGTKGAGKSTFIDRFFRLILPKPLLKQCVVARIDLKGSKGNEAGVTDWLDRTLLETLEEELFREEEPTYDEVRGMFFDEYRRLSKGSLKPLYESDREAFRIQFGLHIERRREERPHEYITRLVGSIVTSRKKLPCIIFDNADHFTIEFQERVFQYARSVYEGALCLVIMPITDRTSWQLSTEGALRSFENESFFLPTPHPKLVLQKRIQFVQERVEEEKQEPGKGYFFGRGISLSIDDLHAFSAALQATFLQAGPVPLWIGNLANNDIRRCLELAKNLVSSPHLGVSELLKTYYAGSDLHVPRHKVKRALVKGNYDIYPDGVNSFVRNIYVLEEVETSPLLGVRLLRLLRDAQKSDASDPFVTFEQIVGYLQAMHIDSNVTVAWLSRMLEAGLCLSYDPTVTTVGTTGRFELSPAGWQHLIWGTRDDVYIQAMRQVTPIADRAAFEQLFTLAGQPPGQVWQEEVEHFINYLIAEDAKYCRIPPEHDAYAKQRQIAAELRRTIPVPTRVLDTG